MRKISFYGKKLILMHFLSHNTSVRMFLYRVQNHNHFFATTGAEYDHEEDGGENH